MSALSELPAALLAALPAYGYPLLAAATFGGALGLPLPMSLVLLATGALTADGVLDFGAAIATVVAAAVAGDAGAYLLGRRAGRPLLERAGPRVGLSARHLAAADRAFARWGGATVWLTRWLVTAPGPAVSLLAGANRYRITSFLLLAATGQLLWAAGYASLGWLFGDYWSELVAFVSNVTWAAAAVLGAAVLAGLTWQLARSPASPLPPAAAETRLGRVPEAVGPKQSPETRPAAPNLVGMEVGQRLHDGA
jgi:membrane-associated protein